MKKKRGKFKSFFIIIFSSFGIFVYYTGLYQYLLTVDYELYYVHNGPQESLSTLISRYKISPETAINEFSYPFLYNFKDKCQSDQPVKLIYIIPSKDAHFERRKAIRMSWGMEDRFSDVVIKRVFMLGRNNPQLQPLIDKEINIHRDLIQGDFEDTYTNLTLKTMMSISWAYHYCKNASYFVFVDDDQYVSTRNVLRFIRSPTNYPDYINKYATPVHELSHLYAGHVYENVIPIRWIFNKFYITLSEYEYSRWPPYVSGSMYILSRPSVEKIYFGSIFTKPFKFEDVFLGMAAKKAGLRPFHHNEFHYPSVRYSLEGYKWIIGAHGFDDPNEMLKVWNEQRAAGNT